MWCQMSSKKINNFGVNLINSSIMNNLHSVHHHALGIENMVSTSFELLGDYTS